MVWPEPIFVTISSSEFNQSSECQPLNCYHCELRASQPECRHCPREQVLGELESGQNLGSSPSRTAQQHWGSCGWETNCVGPSAPHLRARKAKPSAPEPSARAAPAPQRALISSVLSPLLHTGCAREIGDFHTSLSLAFAHWDISESLRCVSSVKHLPEQPVQECFSKTVPFFRREGYTFLGLLERAKWFLTWGLCC